MEVIFDVKLLLSKPNKIRRKIHTESITLAVKINGDSELVTIVNSINTINDISKTKAEKLICVLRDKNDFSI
jgi:hypothetical protein